MMNLRRLGLTLALLMVLISAAVMINADVAQEFGTGWTAQYFNNTDLSGSPVPVRSAGEWHQLQLGFVSPRPGWSTTTTSRRATPPCSFSTPGRTNSSSRPMTACVFIDGVLVLDRHIGRALTTDRFQYPWQRARTRWWWSTSRASIRRRSGSVVPDQWRRHRCGDVDPRRRVRHRRPDADRLTHPTDAAAAIPRAR
ncbi:MAG: hypothetical protein IPK19_30260 [Chloroflexi bacterium]|nr:hypothetical protein [Chloroflexota bacterium]